MMENGAHTAFSDEHQRIIGIARRLMRTIEQEQGARCRFGLMEQGGYFGVDAERRAEMEKELRHASFMLDGAILEAWDALVDAVRPAPPAADGTPR